MPADYTKPNYARYWATQDENGLWIVLMNFQMYKLELDKYSTSKI